MEIDDPLDWSAKVLKTAFEEGGSTNKFIRNKIEKLMIRSDEDIKSMMHRRYDQTNK